MILLLLALLSAQAHGCNFVDTPNPPCVPKSKVTARLHQLLRSVTASKQPQQTRNGFTSIGIQAAKSRNLPEAVAHFRASAFYKPGEPQSLENLALILRDTALTLVNKGKKQRKSAWRMLSEAVACYELVFYLRNKPIANNGQMKGTYALVSVLFGLPVLLCRRLIPVVCFEKKYLLYWICTASTRPQSSGHKFSRALPFHW